MSDTRRKNCDRCRAEIRENTGAPGEMSMGAISVHPPSWATKILGMERHAYSLDYCRPECLVAHFHEMRGKWVPEFNAQNEKQLAEIAAMNNWRSGQGLGPLT